MKERVILESYIGPEVFPSLLEKAIKCPIWVEEPMNSRLTRGQQEKKRRECNRQKRESNCN